jgi:site-specific DNA recombinase
MKQLDEIVWADLCELLMHPESIRQALERAQSGEWLPKAPARAARSLAQGQQEPVAAD